ncbi:MAG: S8 family serine peptidase [Limnobacter sp.]|nr:S8 family serine peptidase [Limnobacter sp.]
MATLGPLLRTALERIDRGEPARGAHERQVLAADAGTPAAPDAPVHGARLPLVVQFGRTRPRRGERWPEFRERVARSLEPACDAIAADEGRPLYLANALACSFAIERIPELAARDDVSLIELDPRVDPTLMDDAVEDVGLGQFRQRHGEPGGAGVRVAVLDSGIDLRHPYLKVAESMSTCDEDVAIPGRHGTHCAGALASRDPVFPGIAPEVELLNVKVLRHDGSGRHTNVTKGIDAALDLEAQILSISLGFNHLPTWSDGGHGWHCPNGRCPLCMAVDNATAFGALVVVAAGNEHMRAETLSRFGQSAGFDTELCCPGQARGALTVGALTKRSFLPAGFSSRGPAAWGGVKPDLAAPGVNLMSTIPVPRLPDGQLAPDPARADLFGRASGTSAATPIVAGAAALLLQAARASGRSIGAAALRRRLLEQAVSPMSLPPTLVGAGRLDLGRFGVKLVGS